jgi:hypothetical protein
LLIAGGTGEQQITSSEFLVFPKYTRSECGLRDFVVVAIYHVQPPRNARGPGVEDAVVAEVDVAAERRPRLESVFAGDARLRVVQAQIHCSNLAVILACSRRQRSAYARKSITLASLQLA